MHEYVTVSASSYDPAALATKLTEKSADGWDVVSIVQTGGDVTAFLRRDAAADDTADEVAETAAAESDEAADAVGAPEAVIASEALVTSVPDAEPAAADPVAEPAGWAAEPEPAAETVADEVPAAAAAAAVVADPTPAATPAPEAEPAAAAAPAVPAGWYADPSGRFELRYWDGGQWTEHVARGGQQFTDPPVA